MSAHDNGLLGAALGRIEARLDGLDRRIERVEGKVDTLAGDLAALRAEMREHVARTEERLEQGSKTFAAHDRRLADLEVIADQVRGHCAVERHRSGVTERRWRRIGVIGGLLAVAGTWAGLLGRALGWW